MIDAKTNAETEAPHDAARVVEKPEGYGKIAVAITGATLEAVLRQALHWSQDFWAHEARTQEAEQLADGTWIVRGSRWSRL